MENSSTKEGKVIAIISYITIIGTLIALTINKKKKNDFSSFHVRQALGINILYLINQYIMYQPLGRNLGWVFGLFIFVFWFIGVIGAIQGEEKLIPFLGTKFQQWFKSI